MNQSTPTTTRKRMQWHQGCAWSVLASLLWIPQAALLAISVQAIANQHWDQIGYACVGVLVLGCLRAAADAYGMHESAKGARLQLQTLRARVVRQLAAQSPLDVRRVPSGQAASALAEQAEAIVPWLSRYQTAMWRTMLVPLALALAVASQSWVAALILVCAAPLIPFFMAIVGWRAQSASQEQLVQLGQMNAFLLDRLRGIGALRAMGATERVAQRLDAHAQDVRVRTMKVLRIAFLSSAVLELFSALGVAMCAVYVGFHLLGHLEFGAWAGKLTLGQGLFVLMLAPAFFEPLRELAAVWHDRASGQAAMQVLDALGEEVQPVLGDFAEQSIPKNATHAKAFSVQWQDLCVANVALSDGMVREGERVALWGGSGSGKSLLLAAMAGLVPASRGQVQLTDEVLDTHNAAQWRAQMAWMGQHPHVFAGSIDRNVHMEVHAHRHQVESALTQVGLGAVLQDRAAQSLGEGGQGLSGGEVARLALARLSLAASSAGLVLVDEPTAHLDPQTAATVRAALLEITAGKTLVVATHDPLLAAAMDRVIDVQALQTIDCIGAEA